MARRRRPPRRVAAATRPQAVPDVAVLLRAGLVRLAQALGPLLEPVGASPMLAAAGTGDPPPVHPRGAGGTDLGHDPAADEQALVADLVRRAQSGDGEAFGQLYDRYSGTVFRFVYVRVGSTALAEDLTSETFLRALRRIDTFSWQGRDIGAWFVTIARNLIADHYKSSRTRREWATPDVRDAAPEQAIASPEEALLAALDADRVMAAVGRLKPDQREVIQLRFFDELPIADVARVMDRNEGAVKALQHRAVRSLARILQGDAT